MRATQRGAVRATHLDALIEGVAELLRILCLVVMAQAAQVNAVAHAAKHIHRQPVRHARAAGMVRSGGAYREEGGSFQGGEDRGVATLHTPPQQTPRLTKVSLTLTPNCYQP